MSKITQEDIDHVAQLSRLELTTEEKLKFSKELEAILNYIDELNSANTEDIEPISQISGLSNIARIDKIANKNDRAKMLENAPEQQDGFIKVKQVFE